MPIFAGNLPHVFNPTKTFAFQLRKSESVPWIGKVNNCDYKRQQVNDKFDSVWRNNLGKTQHTVAMEQNLENDYFGLKDANMTILKKTTGNVNRSTNVTIYLLIQVIWEHPRKTLLFAYLTTKSCSILCSTKTINFEIFKMYPNKFLDFFLLMFHDRFAFPIFYSMHACGLFVCLIVGSCVCVQVQWQYPPALEPPLSVPPPFRIPMLCWFWTQLSCVLYPPIAQLLESQPSCWRCVLGLDH